MASWKSTLGLTGGELALDYYREQDRSRSVVKSIGYASGAMIFGVISIATSGPIGIIAYLGAIGAASALDPEVGGCTLCHIDDHQLAGRIDELGTSNVVSSLDAGLNTRVIETLALFQSYSWRLQAIADRRCRPLAKVLFPELSMETSNAFVILLVAAQLPHYQYLKQLMTNEHFLPSYLARQI